MAKATVKQLVRVPELFESHNHHAYEQCVVAGNMIFVAGQVGWDKDKGVVSKEFEPQVRKAFADIRACLNAAGADLAEFVSMTVYVTDIAYGSEFLCLRKEILAGNYATSSLIGVNELFHPDLLVEISAIAVRDIA
jgi:2-iminobutanoate/2-iminopropanoate deaminase